MDIIIKKFYDAYKTNSESVLAYKGGSIEKDSLRKLSIPAINSELYGCPKATDIFPKMAWLENCGKHSLLENRTNTYEHCL